MRWPIYVYSCNEKRKTGDSFFSFKTSEHCRMLLLLSFKALNHLRGSFYEQHKKKKFTFLQKISKLNNLKCCIFFSFEVCHSVFCHHKILYTLDLKKSWFGYQKSRIIAAVSQRFLLLTLNFVFKKFRRLWLSQSSKFSTSPWTEKSVIHFGKNSP